jgi:trimethylamine:corrinoid methyltransferase-like protein
LQARTIGDIDATFTKGVELQAGALVVGTDAADLSKVSEIAALAARYGIPAIADSASLSRLAA